jgi:hypothetical protein
MKSLIPILFVLISGSLFAQSATIVVNEKTYTFTSFISNGTSALPAGLNLPDMPKSQTMFRAADDKDRSIQFMFDADQFKGKKAPFNLKILSFQFHDNKKVLQIGKEDIFIAISEYDEATQTFSGTLEGPVQNMTAIGFGSWKKSKAVVTFEKVKI